MESIFKNRNETDILAAMNVWAQTLSRERQIELAPDMMVLRELDKAVSALREHRIDGLTMSLSEYAAFPEGLLSGPFFRHEQNGSARVRYALVVNRNDGIRGFGGLHGARLGVHGNDAHLARAWLEAQLASAGLEPLATAAAITDSERTSTCVLDVFFGRADACLVRRGVFENVAELNPQVARRLMVVAESEPVIPTFFCYRTGLPRPTRDRLLEAALGLHESVTGEQVLRVFGSSRMRSVTAEEVDRSVRQLNAWRQTAGGSGMSHPAGPGAPATGKQP